MSEPIPAGSTDQTIDVFLQDSSSSTGAGLTGLLYNTSGLTCYYRKGATGTSTQLSLVQSCHMYPPNRRSRPAGAPQSGQVVNV